MIFILSRIILLGGLCCATLNAQLHLITGSPTPKHNEAFGSALFRVNGGTVQLVEELVSEKVGTDWIGVSYDLNKAVFLPRAFIASDWLNPIVVLDMVSGRVAKRCRFAAPSDLSLVGHWLANTPSRGHILELEMADSRHSQLTAMILDAAVPCEETFATGEPTDLRFAVASGIPGVADLAQGDGFFAVVDPQDHLMTVVARTRVYFEDYTVPADLRIGIVPYFSGVEVNTARLLVMALIAENRQTYRIVVLNKSTKTWSTLPAVSVTPPAVRAFEHYLAFPVSQPAKGREGRVAGSKEWRQGASRMGPDLHERFKDLNRDYSGRLCLYDSATQKLWTIETNQADSEVLLIENGQVYYRVSDRLYQMTIGPKGLGRRVLIATSDVIRDAHWAFRVKTNSGGRP